MYSIYYKIMFQDPLELVFCNENCARMYAKDLDTIAVTFWTAEGRHFSQWWW